MITKSDWQKFWKYVNNIRLLGMCPHIKGDRIYQMNVQNYEIKTINEDRTLITSYTHKSLSSGRNLRFLYSSVTCKHVSLYNIIKFSQYLNEKN